MEVLHDLFESNGFSFTAQHVQELHSVLMQGILPEQECGHWRAISLRISGSEDVLPAPDAVPKLMENFFTTTAVSIGNLDTVARVHYEFVKIHPFTDGNGRIARILMNLGLIHLGYFPIIIPKAVRGEYIASLQGDNFETWYQFFLRQIYENHKDYLRFL